LRLNKLDYTIVFLLLIRIIKKKRITPTNNSKFSTKNSKLSLISPPKCCIFALSFQSAEDSRQKTDDRRQKTVGSQQKTEDSRQTTVSDYCPLTSDY